MYIVTFDYSPAKKNCSDPPLFLGWRRHWSHFTHVVWCIYAELLRSTPSLVLYCAWLVTMALHAHCGLGQLSPLPTSGDDKWVAAKHCGRAKRSRISDTHRLRSSLQFRYINNQTLLLLCSHCRLSNIDWIHAPTMNDEFIYLFILTNKRLYYIVDQLQFSPNYQPTVGVDYGFKIHRVFGKDRMYHV